MADLPKGHEHVTGEIRDTEFVNWPISGKAANEGSTMTEQDNIDRLIDVLTALHEDGTGWEDVELLMRKHFEIVSGVALPSRCDNCGIIEDAVFCEQCHQEGDHDCMYRDMDPECKVCHMDVTHPLCEDHAGANVYTDLGFHNKDASAWCEACSTVHKHGVCPHFWYDGMNSFSGPTKAELGEHLDWLLAEQDRLAKEGKPTGELRQIKARLAKQIETARTAYHRA